MPKGSPELTAARRDEIMDACEHLYRTMSFREINLKEIGKVTSFTRTSIYNYFQTKEEIFLALFEREYRNWTDDLRAIASSPEKPGTEALAAELAKSLTSRELMLRLLSANLYDLEDNSRIERLTEFKRAYFKSTEAMDSILAKQFHGMSEKERRLLLLTLFEFIHGVYPYAYATPKQKKAMNEVGVRYGEYTLYELTYEGMKRILKSAEEKEK